MGVTITPHNLKLWFYLRNLARQRQISSIWECYMRLCWLYVLQIFVLFNYVRVPVCLRMSACEGQVPTGSRIKHQIQSLLELKLQAAGSCLTWVLGTDLCQRSNNGPISLAISLRSTSITLLCPFHGGKIHVLYTYQGHHQLPKFLFFFIELSMFNSDQKTQNAKLSLIVLEFSRVLISLSVLPAKRYFWKWLFVLKSFVVVVVKMQMSPPCPTRQGWPIYYSFPLDESGL